MAAAGKGKRRVSASDLGRYGSVAAGSVDVDRAAKGLKVSKTQVRQALSAAKSEQASVMFRAVSGRESADLGAAASMRGLLQAAYGPGPRGGAVDARAAAKDLGVSVSTIRRWAAGTQNPSADHQSAVRSKARKASRTKDGRRSATRDFRNSDGGRAALRRGSKLTISGDQGPQDYPRDRSITLDVSADDMEAMLAAYEDGGDAGLHDWMNAYVDANYLADWEFLTIDELGIGGPE